MPEISARLVAAALLVAATTHPATGPAAVEGPQEAAPEASQFDFWVGEWDVNLRVRQDDLSWQDSIQARAQIFSILDGKAILELWDAPTIKGYSLRYFDVARDEWVLWLNWPGENRAGSSSLSGGFRHGRGEFFSTSSNSGTETLARYTFSDITAESLRWDDAFSTDGGGTWTNNWIMEFSRTGPRPTLPAEGGPAHTYVDGKRCTLPAFGRLAGLAGRREGRVGEEHSVMTGYNVLDGCAVIAVTATPGAGPSYQGFLHLTYNTYASRFELTTLDAGRDSAAQVFYSQPGAEEIVLYPPGTETQDRRVRFEIRHGGPVTVIWESPEGDGWVEVFTSSFQPPS
jgi:hypothetical protein